MNPVYSMAIILFLVGELSSIPVMLCFLLQVYMRPCPAISQIQGYRSSRASFQALRWPGNEAIYKGGGHIVL